MTSTAYALALLAGLVGLLLTGCRHVVVERDFGRVDGDRSISTNSELDWKIQREPSPVPPEASPADAATEPRAR